MQSTTNIRKHSFHSCYSCVPKQKATAYRDFFFLTLLQTTLLIQCCSKKLVSIYIINLAQADFFGEGLRPTKIVRRALCKSKNVQRNFLKKGKGVTVGKTDI